MQPGEKQLGEMQHFNTTPLGEMQPGEMQFGEMQLSQIKEQLKKNNYFKFYSKLYKSVFCYRSPYPIFFPNVPSVFNTTLAFLNRIFCYHEALKFTSKFWSDVSELPGFDSHHFPIYNNFKNTRVSSVKFSEKVRWDESSRNCDFFLENDSYRKKGYKNNYKK
ncbi:hypothetical protein H8356DRAFT_1324365 [Neocallimastix lanati (nom. inval.)]|nr:hypothetical protein H8356DRAFT_1324365 [Neocallimastix sp. JGI-2020a]